MFHKQSVDFGYQLCAARAMQHIGQLSEQFLLKVAMLDQQHGVIMELNRAVEVSDLLLSRQDDTIRRHEHMIELQRRRIESLSRQCKDLRRDVHDMESHIEASYTGGK